MFATKRSAVPNTTYLARPVQAGQHPVARNASPSPVPPPAPPVAPPPPAAPQQFGSLKAKPVVQKAAEVKPIFDRDKLLNEVRSGVQLRHTVTVDKSAPIGVGRVRSGGYSPPRDSVASTFSPSSYSRPDAKKPVFYGQRIEEAPPAPPAPAPPKAPPPAALLKIGSATNFDRDKLLSEIQGGVRLRKTVTNDRSAPIGVGTVRTDLSPSPSPIPETFAASAPPPPPSMPPPPSPSFLSPEATHHKAAAKPITNPALLKLGGKQPIDRDALLASIRSGVKLRKVEPGSSAASRDASPSPQGPVEPAVAPPPPPPLLVAPPPPPSSDDAGRRSRSRSPNPMLSKLGGKVTVDRDELMRSIRQGVKLRKVVTNDKSSAVLNDDDSGVKSPGRSSPSTSNFDDDVYGSQSLSDLSSCGASRFSSLSNIVPAERPSNEFYASPHVTATENGTSAPKPLYSDGQQMININIACADEGEEEEAEEVEDRLPKPKDVESYTSPIPTREQIEAEIPAGSARDRIKMFAGRQASPPSTTGPLRGRTGPKKADIDVDNSEFGVARVKKLFSEGEPQAIPPVPGQPERGAAVTSQNGGSSIRKMVQKFSAEDTDPSKTSQPVWCQKQKEEEKGVAEAPAKTSTVKRKTSGAKGSMRKKSGAGGTRRKSLAKNEPQPAATVTAVSAEPPSLKAPRKSRGMAPELPTQEMEQQPEEAETKSGPRWTPPKVDVSKFRERFENPPSLRAEQPAPARRGSSATSDETAKPGRIKKPPWIKEEQKQDEIPQVAAPVPQKVEELPRPIWKKTVRAPDLPVEATKAPNKLSKSFVQQESEDHEDSPEPVVEKPSVLAGRSKTTRRPAPTLNIPEEPPPLPSSLPPRTSQKQIAHVPVTADETTENVASYPYLQKTKESDKKSTGLKKNSALGGTNLLNSVPKPFGTHLSTTGQTTTIGADDIKEEPKPAAGRQFVFKPKSAQPAKPAPERDEAFGEKKAPAKKTTETTDGVHYANVGVTVSRIYAVPINAPWYHPETNPSASSSSSSPLSPPSPFSSSPVLNSDNNTGTARRHCRSPMTGREYPDDLWNCHRQQQPPRAWNGAVGRAHRVIVGQQRNILATFQRSFDANDPCESEQRVHDFFSRDYRFEIDLENNQQPIRLVPR